MLSIRTRSIAMLFAFAIPMHAVNASQIPVDVKKVIDPGGPPPFVAAEYDKYRVNGSAELRVPFVIRGSDGTSMPCRVGNDEAALYPDTHYVEWMLAKYLWFIQNTQKIEPSTGPSPSDGFALPDYLYLSANPREAVRFASCDANSYVTFRNLPEGSYIFMGQLFTHVLTGTTVPHTTYGIDPGTGLVYSSTREEARESGYIKDFYGLASYAMPLKQGEAVTMDASMLHVVYFRARR